MSSWRFITLVFILTADSRYARGEPELIINKMNPVMVQSLFTRAKYGKNNAIGEYMHPTSGEVFIFDKHPQDSMCDVIKVIHASDGYNWENNGVHTTNRIRVSYNDHINEEGEQSGFKKVSYNHTEMPFVIVHYRGPVPEREDRVVKKSKRKPQRGPGRPPKAAAVNVPEEPEHEPEDSLPKMEVGDRFERDQREEARDYEDYVAKVRAAVNPLRTDKHEFAQAIPYLTDVEVVRCGLTPRYVENLLIETPEEHFMDARHFVITEPRNGDIYLFNVGLPTRVPWEKHLTVDGYSWKRNNMHSQPGYRFTARKDYLRKSLEPDQPKVALSAMKRYIFDNNYLQRVLIHYSGDDSLLEHQPHGNAKNERRFIRTSEYVKVNFVIFLNINTSTSQNIQCNIKFFKIGYL